MDALGRVLISILLLAFGATPAAAQDAEKPRLAIRTIAPTQAVLDQARANSQANVLDQITQGADSLLVTAITRTRRFDIVARSHLADVLKEQGLADSGNVNLEDKQIAQAFKLAGARYVAAATVNNYQDVTARMETAGQFGKNAAERRTIQLQATLAIYDTTTAVLLESATITVDESGTTEALPGEERDGRLTNALIGEVSKKFATDAANAILKCLAPAKVVAYTLGTITVNRGEGTGVEVGQYWEVLHAGRPMIDPETGENLGAEEIHVGWAAVVAVNEKTSRAEALQDSGIDCGDIMRWSKTGLPADVNPNARATGTAPCGNPAKRVEAPPLRPKEPSAPTPISASPAPVPAAAGANEQSDAPGDRAVSLALFVQDVSPDVPDQKVEVLAGYLSAGLTAPHVKIIDRDVVLNAVSRFAKDGANRGAGDPKITEIERLLSDQASAQALGRLLFADGLVVATITSLHEDVRQLNDPDIGVSTTNVATTLGASWKVVDGATGGSLASGNVEAIETVRQTPTLQRSPASIDHLLRDAAEKIAPQVRSAMANPERRPQPADAQMVAVKLWIEMQDMSVPEIRKVNGEWTVAANRYQLVPLGCNVLVDGVLAGTAPGEVRMAPGPHRLRIERPGLEPIDQFVAARDGLELRIAVQLTEDGRRRWMEQARFFEALKDGAALREAEEKSAEALAEFLRNSRVTIDTSDLQNLGLWQLLVR